MKNTIFLDTGVISLYISNHKEILEEIRVKKKIYQFIASELNYIELFNHICREKGKVNAQIIMENLRREEMITFLPVSNKISILAGEIKCKHWDLSLVDAVITAEALIRKVPIYTTETHLIDVENLKIKKFNF
jgi:predicted nucleic acid-binding protein